MSRNSHFKREINEKPDPGSKLESGFSINGLASKLFDDLALPRSGRFAVAYSGGCDSRVLLDALVELRERYGFELRALHFDHGIHCDSDLWRKRCEKICLDYDVAFTYERRKVQVGPGENLEALARNQRYQWFASVVENDVIVLTAHHCDDQAETILLGLLKGLGQRALNGITERRPILYRSKVELVRPLLNYSRQELVEFAGQRNLTWIDDPSNQSMDFDRNYIRQQIWPKIRQRWPQAGNSFSRAKRQNEQILAVYDAQVEAHYHEVIRPEKRRVFCIMDPISLRQLRRLDANIFAQVLRQWIHKVGLSSPSDGWLHDAYTKVNQSEVCSPGLDYQGYGIRGFDGYFHFMRAQNFCSPSQCMSFAEGQVVLASLGLKMVFCDADGYEVLGCSEAAFCETFNLYWRQGGERLHLPGRGHRHELKKVLQSYRVPPWERDRLPMLMVGGEIIWVAGVGWLESANQLIDIHQVSPRFLSLCD